MSDILQVQARGIKCDNKDCNWSDMGVAFDADHFHNKPCPECGENLLTDADYKFIKRMDSLVYWVNMINPVNWFRKGPSSPIKGDELHFDLNGSGKSNPYIKKD